MVRSAHANSVSAIKKCKFQNLIAHTSRIKGGKGAFYSQQKNDISVKKEATQLEGRTYACLDRPHLDPKEIYIKATHYVSDVVAVNSDDGGDRLCG